ncbi:hypothetical protein, partial [Heyndrickxia coagulans]|uniref:hypothetical protein n=1 Tax=Heyndrickxia coagulans TaxID=1398 RepID=UPI00214D391B
MSVKEHFRPVYLYLRASLTYMLVRALFRLVHPDMRVNLDAFIDRADTYSLILGHTPILSQIPNEVGN